MFLERVLEARRPPSPAGAQPQWPFPDPRSRERLWPNTERRKNGMEKLVRLSREGSPNSLRLTPKSLRELLGEGEIWAISNLLLDSELLLLGLRGGMWPCSPRQVLGLCPQPSLCTSLSSGPRYSAQRVKGHRRRARHAHSRWTWSRPVWLGQLVNHRDPGHPRKGPGQWPLVWGTRAKVEVTGRSGMTSCAPQTLPVREPRARARRCASRG